MKKHEATSALLLRSWLRANTHVFPSCGIECKDTRGKDIFNIKEYKEEQRNHALASASDHGNLMRTVGTTGIPDYVYLKKSPTYLMVKYPTCIAIFLVDDTFLAITQNIHVDEAKKIAKHVILV